MNGCMNEWIMDMDGQNFLNKLSFQEREHTHTNNAMISLNTFQHCVYIFSIMDKRTSTIRSLERWVGKVGNKSIVNKFLLKKKKKTATTNNNKNKDKNRIK